MAPTPNANEPRAGRYRVIQWATGNIGRRSLRSVIEHPNMDLVGLYVHSDAKAGRDAGELCGIGSTGIVATQNVDELVALDADCVLYMRQGMDIDEITSLLESGANVVTTSGEFHHPASMDIALRDRVEAACERGSTSIHSTGISPGSPQCGPLLPPVPATFTPPSRASHTTAVTSSTEVAPLTM